MCNCRWTWTREERRRGWCVILQLKQASVEDWFNPELSYGPMSIWSRAELRHCGDQPRSATQPSPMARSGSGAPDHTYLGWNNGPKLLMRKETYTCPQGWLRQQGCRPAPSPHPPAGLLHSGTVNHSGMWPTVGLEWDQGHHTSWRPRRTRHVTGTATSISLTCLTQACTILR